MSFRWDPNQQSFDIYISPEQIIRSEMNVTRTNCAQPGIRTHDPWIARPATITTRPPRLSRRIITNQIEKKIENFYKHLLIIRESSKCEIELLYSKFIQAMRKITKDIKHSKIVKTSASRIEYQYYTILLYMAYYYIYSILTAPPHWTIS